MTILCRPRPRDWGAMLRKTWPAARPSFSAVSAVTGSMLAVPRTPSVPKSFLFEFTSIDALGGNRDIDFLRQTAKHRHPRRRCDLDSHAHITRFFDISDIHQHA